MSWMRPDDSHAFNADRPVRDAGSLLGLTYGLIAGWTAWRAVFHVMWAIYLEQRQILWEENYEHMLKENESIGRSLFNAIVESGIFEDVEETVH